MRCYVQDQAKCVGVRLGRALYVLTVTATECNHQGNGARCVQHQAVALLQPVQGERQASQPVTRQAVYSRLIKNHFRTEGRHFRQHLLQLPQVFRVARPVGQRDIDAAALLAEGEVVLAVHGEREHGGVFREDGSGSIALMDIQVDHRGARGEPVAAQRENGHRQVVEHAESGAFAAKRVVRAAGQVAAEAVLHRVARGRQRAAHRGQRAAHQFRRPRKPDAAHHALADSAVQYRLHVRSIVREFNGGSIPPGAPAEDRKLPSAASSARSRAYFSTGNLWPGGSGMGWWSQ